MMDGVVPFVVLSVSGVVLSFASRRWRTTIVPWGVVALYTGVAVGAGLWLAAAVALIIVAIEAGGRTAALSDTLPAVLVAALFLTRPEADLATTVLRLMAMIAAAVTLGLLLKRIPRGGQPTRAQRPWTEVATGLLLLASATLLASGLFTGLPLLMILGIFTPALFPALLEDAVGQATTRGKVNGFVSSAETLVSTLSMARVSRPEALASLIHTAFEPYLAHQATVLALSPGLGFGCSVVIGCHPLAEESLPRIRERARHTLQSGRRDSLVGVRVTTLADRDHLHPDFQHQVLIPLRRGRQLVALLAFLGDHRLLPPDLEADFADAAAAILELLLEQRSLEERIEFLSQRADDQGERLRQLLRLGQIVNATSDPKRVTENLTRTVCEVFGFGRCELLLDVPGGDSSRRVAAWGNGNHGWLGPAGGEMKGSAVAAALTLGTPMSRTVVVPAEAWPAPETVSGDVGHLLVLGLGREDRRIGHLVAIPRRETELPDLNELRILEILVEQVTPALASTLKVEELHRQALIDDLTRVSNRRGLDHRLARAVSEADDGGEPFAFAMIDADGFKSVNDRYGHRVGDVVLHELAQVLAARVRALDFVARYGGEEFSVVLPGLAEDQAMAVLERLRASIADHGFARTELSHPLTLTVSIGVSFFPFDADTVQGLIERADAALYRAKALGKNQVLRDAGRSHDLFLG